MQLTPEKKHQNEGEILAATMERCFRIASLLLIVLSTPLALATDCDANGVDDSLQYDLDGDTVIDACDNCLLVANPNQEDSNGDGYGNYCDADLNNDEVVNFVDLGRMKSVFFTADADADLNSDGVVNFVDLGLMKSSFFKKPGPGPQILGPGLPGVRVGSVRGNTVEYGSAAEFDVSLITKPLADVTFFIMSTDETEGIPENNEFTFTPSNWNQQQTVVIRGQNGAPDDTVQDYHITFGPTMSGDSAYDGLYMPPVAMKGLSLEIVDPPQPINLLANIEEQLGIDYVYTGYDALIFGLTASPAGMTIDSASGLLSWTPLESDEGQTFPVTVTVTDGVVSDDLSFELGVFQPEPLDVVNTETSVTVSNPETNLNGLAISSIVSEPQTNFSELGIDTLPIDEVPGLPSWITPISDAIILSEPLDEEAELRFPISMLPQGVSLNDINLYLLTESTEINEKVWLPVSIQYYFEGTTQAPVYVAKLGTLDGMAIIGFHGQASPAALAPPAARSLKIQKAIGEVTCVDQGPLPDGEYEAGKNLLCTTAGAPVLNVTVHGFDAMTRWDGKTVEDMVLWFADTAEKVQSLGLATVSDFTVKIGPGIRDNEGTLVALGSHSSGNIFIAEEEDEYDVARVPATVVHEYFHAVQWAVSESIPDSFANLRPDYTNWFDEGSATWFADEVYDSLNSYEFYSDPLIRAVLETGINPYKGKSKDQQKNPYKRFALLKLLEGRCSGFVAPYLTASVDKSVDPMGLKTLESLLKSLACDFGQQLGATNQDSLEAALIYYQYAALHASNMGLLDSDESPHSDLFWQKEYRFKQGDTDWLPTVSDWRDRTNTSPYTLQDTSNIPADLSSIPATGAYSFKVEKITGTLPEGYSAELSVNVVGAGDVTVSLMSEDAINFPVTNAEAGPLGGNPHDWYVANSSRSSYRYGSVNDVPELFVTLVNPSLDNAVKVNVSFNIVDTTPEPATSTLNDTGITFGGNYPSGNNAGCTGVTIAQQDCSNGRDAYDDDDTDGHAGFSFTKLDSDGSELPAGAANWSCVKDNVTGRVWEVKTDDGSIHDNDNTYRWGGKTRQGDGYGGYYSDWDVLVDGTNAEVLCGYEDWRVPTRFELESLVNHGRTNPSIDIEFFPNTRGSSFWSASPSANSSVFGWNVGFNSGSSDYFSRYNRLRVRLVRSGQ